MTREEIKDKIQDYLEDNVTLGMANAYRDADGGDTIYEMGDFEDEMSNYGYADVINMAQNGDFDDSDNYFTYDSYSIHTFDSLDDEVDTGDMAEYCVENDEDFGDDHIRELLDKLNEKDFTITLRYSEDSFDTFTLDTLKESSEVDRRDYYLCKDDNRILTLTEWIDELGKLTTDDGVEEVNLIKLDFEQLAREKELPHLSVVGYYGYVFGGGYVDGRPFKWFYNVEHNILLKLVYDADKDADEYRYIVEVKDKFVEDVFRLVMDN